MFKQFDVCRYQGGLDKLVATNAMVNELQNEIIKLQPVLQTAAKETAELIHIVTKDKEAAAVVQANVEEEATKVCISCTHTGFCELHATVCVCVFAIKCRKDATKVCISCAHICMCM